MSWRVARSLNVLLEEIDAAAPRRSKVSDGSIGDAAHASRDSDHNPFVIKGGQGIVRARDFTHDPDGGLDCNRLADALAAIIAVGGHPAARSGAYVIWQRRIFSFDRRGEGWRPYTGSNPHDHHCHLSVTTDPAGFDSPDTWGVMQEDDMFSDDDRATLNSIGRDLETFRKNLLARDRAFRKATMARLAELADDVADDATKAQVQRVRADLAAMVAEDAEV